MDEISASIDGTDKVASVVYEAPLVIVGPHHNVQELAAKVRAFLRRLPKAQGLRIELKDGLWMPMNQGKPLRDPISYKQRSNDGTYLAHANRTEVSTVEARRAEGAE
jgi:hypothetical protein